MRGRERRRWAWWNLTPEQRRKRMHSRLRWRISLYRWRRRGR